MRCRAEASVLCRPKAPVLCNWSEEPRDRLSVHGHSDRRGVFRRRH